MAQPKSDPKMAIWDQVKTTDQDFTKTQTLDGRPVTSINGLYMVQRATELFGPIGKGWGYEVLIDRYDEGAPITNKDGAVTCRELMHTLQIKLWYSHGGKRNSLTHYGHTPYVRKSQYGAYTDFDAPKKSLTDAIKKCLSMLGFCADVYLGMFEDETYLQGLELKKRLDEAGDEGTVMDEAQTGFKDWLRSQLEALNAAPNLRAHELMRKLIVEKARAKALIVKFNPDDIEARINEASNARLEKLTHTQPTHAEA